VNLLSGFIFLGLCVSFIYAKNPIQPQKLSTRIARLSQWFAAIAKACAALHDEPRGDQHHHEALASSDQAEAITEFVQVLDESPRPARWNQALAQPIACTAPACTRRFLCATLRYSHLIRQSWASDF